MNHYVYKLKHKDNNKYYFGSRSCKCNPKEDTYMGSMIVWNPDKSKLVKTIIKDDFKTREEANIYEAEIIAEYIDDELNENYHIPDKGFHTVGRRFSHSEETKKKIGNKHRGRIHTKKAKINMRNGQLGIKLSEETKKKISLALKDKYKGRYSLNWFIEKYGKEDGTRKYLEKNKNHSKKLTGRKLKPEHIKKSALGHQKSIIQYDKKMNYIKEWDSIKNASDSLNIHEGSICWCCKSKVKSAGGFIWMYK